MTTEYYQADLAFIHDSGYRTIARQAAERVLVELSNREIHQGLVIDLGCGSGVLAEIVSNAGYNVLGVDISPAMIELARKRAPSACFTVGSLLNAELPACVAVAATGEALNYLFDPATSPDALFRLFQQISAVLDPNGILLFDAAEPARRTLSPSQRFTVNDDWTTLVEIEDTADPTLLVRHITTFRKIGELYRRSQEVHRQRLYPRSYLEDTLRSSGLKAALLNGYGDLPFPPGIVGFLATRA